MTMKTIYINLDDENRLKGGWGSTPSPNSIEIEVEDDHEVLDNPFIYRYENGELIKDSEWQAQKVKEREELDAAPSMQERFEMMEMLTAELVMGNAMKDMIISEQAENLSNLEGTHADLLIELTMKGVI
jgi:hypothetical protein